MTNVSLISYPELNQDTINQVAQCRASLIAIFRELRKNDHSEIELGPSLPINMLNRTLFDLIKQMLGKDKEHAAIVQSFLNCNRLMLDEIADMSYCEFNLYCCNHFVGFKSKMTPEEVFSALDGEIRPVGTDLCHEEKFRFIQAYWLEIWRYVRSNYLHTKFCTQLDLDILNKLSVSSADQLARFLLDDRQTFVLTFDIEKILEFRKTISSPPPPQVSINACLPDVIPPLGIVYSKKKQENPEGNSGTVRISINNARIRAEDTFLQHAVVLQHLLMFHRMGQGQLQSAHSSQLNHKKLALHPFPSLVDFAYHLIKKAQLEPVNFKRQLRLKTQMGYNLAMLGGSKKHIRLLCGLSEAQARTAFNNGIAESFFTSAKLPGIKSSRILWQIMVSQFGVFYWNLAGPKICTDLVFDAVLEAWYNVLQYYSKPEWSLFYPYVSNISLFLDWAMWFREGRLSFQYCPHCQLIYVRQEITKSEEREVKECARALRRKKKDDNKPITDCPYCRLRFEIGQ